jgi:aryl-alcohol dehydrogenase-like predicted oxidoreductase
MSVKEIGLGCMGMSEFYGPVDDAESLHVLERAWEMGVNHFDTSDMYGGGHNESLLSRFIAGKKSGIRIATKFGIERVGLSRTINNSAAYIRKSCERSLSRLKIDAIDLYYVHRLDRATPIEETILELKRLVNEGKILQLGLSEVSPDELRRAHAIHPIAAIQSEYSLVSRAPETNGLFEACAGLGVGFVAYSPMGRGLLSTRIRSKSDLSQADFRRAAPRFSDENLKDNLSLADRLVNYSNQLNCTPAQLALAWVLKAAPFVVPIPGTKQRKYLEENLGATEVDLSDEIHSKLGKSFAYGNVKGERYPTQGMKEIYE